MEFVAACSPTEALFPREIERLRETLRNEMLAWFDNRRAIPQTEFDLATVWTCVLEDNPRKSEFRFRPSH